MPSHMSSIGFPVESEDDFLRYQTLAADNGRVLAAPAGTYVRWRAGEGAELWVQVGEENAIVGLNPHFEGTSTLTMRVASRISYPNEAGLDGAFYGWLEEAVEEEAGESVELAFDAPDFALVADLPLPATVQVQLAAFAEDLRTFADEQAFAAAQPADLRLPPEALLAVPAPDTGIDEDAPPEPRAFLTGRVLESELLANPATGEQFRWAKVHTQGGDVDLVADPALAPVDLPAGTIVAATCWLSGRIERPA
jgi:hypothetical protein